MSSDALSPPAAIAGGTLAPPPAATRDDALAAARAALTAALRPGEQVLWWDQPQPRAFQHQGVATDWPVRPRDLGAWLLVTAVATLIAIFGQIDKPAIDWGLVAFIFGFCLVMTGAMLAAQLVGARRQANRIVYAITDRRVLILNAAAEPFDALALPMTGWRIQRGTDGFDSVIFGTAGTADEVETVAFFGVRHVDRVAELAQRTAYVVAGRFPR